MSKVEGSKYMNWSNWGCVPNFVRLLMDFNIQFLITCSHDVSCKVFLIPSDWALIQSFILLSLLNTESQAQTQSSNWKLTL